MKPLNLDNSPCSPISSNCVIWQGPNIPCINLCTGDTVSDVVAKLATELCAIMDTLNITKYDLACLNLAGCDPKDFQALIQLLIQKICDLENQTPGTVVPGGSGCPTDCIVAINACLGGGNDNLVNYVNIIASKICELVDDIHLIQNQIVNINTTLVDLQTQINNIPVYTLPSITIPTLCQIGPYTGPTSVALDTLFSAFLTDWCTYIGTTGTATDLSAVLNPSCTLTDIISEPDWINPVGTLADAINNIWVSICYFYNFTYPQAVVTGSGGIVVTSSYNPGTNTTTYDVTTSTPLTSLMPTGAVIPWAGSGTAPAGWVLCNGASYDYTLDPTYLDLFNAIGTAYGTSGGTTFSVPNLANSIPVGKGTNSDGFDLTTVGNTGGNKAVTLTDAQLPPHTHDVTGATSSDYVNLITASADGTTGDPTTTPRTGDYARIKVGADTNIQTSDNAQQSSPHSHTFTATTDGGAGLLGSAHGNMQPYVVMQYIIKL